MDNEINAKIDKQKTCQVRRYDGSPCGRPLFDEKYCIFHSKDIERKKKEFNDSFKKELEKQKNEYEVYDFSRFIFPISIELGIKFDKSSTFREAKFLGENTNFRFAQFLGENTDFNEAQFSGKNTYFRGAKFLSAGTYFNEAQFSGKNTYFRGAKFLSEATYFFKAKFKADYTDFSEAEFSSRYIAFIKAEFSSECTDFRFAQFLGEWIEFDKAQFSGEEVFLSYSHLENVSNLFECLQYKTKYFKRVKHKIKDFRFFLGDNSEARYPLISRKAKDAIYLDNFKNQHPKIYFVWWLFADCGRSIWRWAVWSISFALAFALLFYLVYCTNPELFKFTALKGTPSLLSFVYYSVVTFTTLGFGDIVPTIEAVQILVMIEVILGYFMLGGLISILAVKLARRS